MERSTERLIAQIEAHCAQANIAPSTFGKEVVNDGKLITRLKAGGSITLKTLASIEAALDRAKGDEVQTKSAAQ